MVKNGFSFTNMDERNTLYNVWVVFLMGVFMPVNLIAQVSVDDFRNPPYGARPSTYWEWMNGNITKEGLTQDLEYMKRCHYGAAMMFEAGVGIPRGPVDYNSSEWADAVEHAVKEAGRLGIRLSMHNSPGYSGTGGPWIPVGHSMKQLVWTEVFVNSDGEETVGVDLPKPCSKMGYYRDAFVLSYPSLPEEGTPFWSLVRKVTCSGRLLDGRLLSDHNWETQYRMEKGGQLLFELDAPFKLQAGTVYRGTREKPLDPHDGPRDYAPSLKVEVSADGKHFQPVGAFICPALRAMDTPGTFSCTPVTVRYVRITTNRATNLSEVDFHASPRLENYAPKINSMNAPVSLAYNPQVVAVKDVIKSSQVVDVTRMVDETGHLKWHAPQGKWTVVRMGYTTTGETVAAAPDAGVGLDCDKFSREAVDCHFDRFLTPLLERLKPWCGTTLEALVIDSWEAGKQNWTEALPEYFQARRGYSLTPYLLAATGRIVDGVDKTERFLWDFRRTHTDMFLENYVGHFKERIARYGLYYAGEAYGDGNFESLEMAARQDYPMSEFWTHYIYGNISTTMMAASAAHVWGKTVVPCECYTGTPFNSKFTEHPYGMKALGDYIMTAGVNRFVYHATTHQPYTGTQPGNIMTMGPFGTHLDRNSTWPVAFSAFNLYNSRCAYMLQQGRYVADVLYLKDEAISSGVNNYNEAYPATPYGYRWDVIAAEGLHRRVSVKDGRYVLPDGMAYRLLVVTPMERTSPETLERILSFLRQGGSVLLAGDKPYGYLGLDAEKDRRVRELAEELWGLSGSGHARVFYKGDIGEILRSMEVWPDFSFLSVHKDAQIHFIHRAVGTEDVYFVANHRRRPEDLTVTCRVSGKVPYLWNAETEETDMPVDYEEKDGRIRLNLRLPESGSMFIVFRPGECVSSPLQVVKPRGTRVQTRKGGSFEYTDRHDFHSTFTLALWAKPETFAAGGRGFLLYPDVTGREAKVGLAMGQNGIRVVEREKSMKVVLDYAGSIEGWTHVTLVYESGKPSLFVNGEKVLEGEVSGRDCRPAIDVPMAEEQYIASFEGDQTPAEVFDYALDAGAIRSLVENGIPFPRMQGTLWQDWSEDWTVCFPRHSKAPERMRLKRLCSLHKNPDFNVRHFSGTATYVKEVRMEAEDWDTVIGGRRIWLDLGRVENMAEVSVNGNKSICLWKEPYKVDVTDMLRPGMNELSVKVTNLYPNRIIGDEHLPELYDYDEYGRIRQLPEWFMKGEYDERERVLFLPWKFYTKDSPLLEAGLLGPVRLFLVD